MCGIVGYTGNHQAAPDSFGWTCRNWNTEDMIQRDWQSVTVTEKQILLRRRAD